jgi:hypothetical protein
MIVPVKYRFLRLNSNTLVLVELYPNSDTPEVCQIQYLEPPYLTKERLETERKSKNTKQIKEWRDDCKFAFNLAVREAKFYPEINYYRTEKNWEKLLWGRLDPLVYWDEYVPLFDNDYNLILR